MRVIAGIARGRPLIAPASERTRPTSDKIKGVIFSMLEAEAYRRGFEPEEAEDERAGRFATAVAWPRVLELYAGSGALAIEALSRGAQHADLVEPNAAARRAIVENLKRTGLDDRATVHRISSEAAVSTLAGPYDLILADPPYDESGVLGVLEGVAARGLAGPSAMLVWEHRRSSEPPEQIGAWRRLKTNAHGVAAVSLYVAADESADGG